MDAERIAALIDGRLGEPERAEVIAQLAASEDDREVFSDALAALGQAESAEDSDPKVTALHPRAERHWGTWGWRGLAAAAVLAAVVAAPWAWDQIRGSASADPARLAIALNGAEGLPDGWEGSPWSAVRGTDAFSEEGRAARLGARLVDLEVAARSRDPRVATIAAEVVALLENVSGAGPVASVYRVIGQRSGDPPERIEPLLERGQQAVTRLLDNHLLELGAWVEAARIAAARQDAAFFRARFSRETLERAASSPTLDPSVLAIAERIHIATDAGEPPVWDAVRSDLTALLATLGR
jgi:hypothetical protein